MKMITTVFVVLNDPCKSLMSNHLSSIATFMSIKVAIQVGDQGVGIAKDGSVLSVHRYAGKVAHMLAGAGELVK